MNTRRKRSDRIEKKWQDKKKNKNKKIIIIKGSRISNR